MDGSAAGDRRSFVPQQTQRAMNAFRITGLVLTSAWCIPCVAAMPQQPQRMQLKELPNPCADHITVIMPTGLQGNTRADVRDGSGRPLLSWPLGIAGVGGAVITLDVPELPPGAYVLCLIDELGNEASTLLIKA